MYIIMTYGYNTCACARACFVPVGCRKHVLGKKVMAAQALLFRQSWQHSAALPLKEPEKEPSIALLSGNASPTFRAAQLGGGGGAAALLANSPSITSSADIERAANTAWLDCVHGLQEAAY